MQSSDNDVLSVRITQAIKVAKRTPLPQRSLCFWYRDEDKQKYNGEWKLYTHKDAALQAAAQTKASSIQSEASTGDVLLSLLATSRTSSVGGSRKSSTGSRQSARRSRRRKKAMDATVANAFTANVGEVAAANDGASIEAAATNGAAGGKLGVGGAARKFGGRLTSLVTKGDAPKRSARRSRKSVRKSRVQAAPSTTTTTTTAATSDAESVLSAAVDESGVSSAPRLKHIHKPSKGPKRRTPSRKPRSQKLADEVVATPHVDDESDTAGDDNEPDSAKNAPSTSGVAGSAAMRGGRGRGVPGGLRARGGGRGAMRGRGRGRGMGAGGVGARKPPVGAVAIMPGGIPLGGSAALRGSAAGAVGRGGAAVGRGGGGGPTGSGAAAPSPPPRRNTDATSNKPTRTPPALPSRTPSSKALPSRTPSSKALDFPTVPRDDSASNVRRSQHRRSRHRPRAQPTPSSYAMPGDLMPQNSNKPKW